MEHFYENIFGFFNFEQIYTDMVNNAENSAHFVEIGSYKGRSTAYMAVEIINSGKDIKFDVIDSWNGEDGTDRLPWSDYVADAELNIPKPSGDIFEEFKTNLAPVWHVINPIQSLSVPAANLYKDKSLDFVFIDGNHNYDYVKQDIIAWLPKVKVGGIIGGHDYNPSWGVKRAVDEIFGRQNISVTNVSWLYIVL